MKVFLVCSTAKNWMATGYGASLLHGDASRLLVSFVEFSKNPRQQLAVTDMPQPYMPSIKAKVPELIAGIGPFVENHMDEIFDRENEPEL